MTSVDIGTMKKIADGHTAEVFEYGRDRILKLFLDAWPMKWAEYEKNVSNVIESLGIPTPKAWDIAECGNRYGVIYDRLDNSNMQSYILKNPLKLGYYAKMLARLHLQVHKAKDVEGKVRSLKSSFEEVIQEKERLTPDQKKKLLDLLGSLPDASCLCHCDFHPQNVLFLKGNPVIIDWMSCVCGDPAADVAGSWLIMNTITVSEQYGKLARKIAIFIKKRFNSIYLKTYLKSSSMTEADIKKWLPIRAATYLDVGLHEDCNKTFYGIISAYCESV